MFSRSNAEALLKDGDTLSGYGILYSHKGFCNFLTVDTEIKVGSFWLASTDPNFDSSPVTIGSKTLESNDGIVVYQITDTPADCAGKQWLNTIDAKALLAKDLFEEQISLQILRAGNLKNVDGQIRYVGEGAFCFVSTQLNRREIIAGTVVQLRGHPIGIARGWGRCEGGGGLGFVALRIDRVEKNLRESDIIEIGADYVTHLEYHNGVYTGPVLNDLPHGSGGTLVFRLGEDKFHRLTDKDWTLTGQFVKGLPEGFAKLTGPNGEDGKPQACEIYFSDKNISRGKCSVFFTSFKSPAGIDPRILQSIEFREGTLQEAIDRGEIDCLNLPKCTITGHFSFKGRYEGEVKNGSKLIFKPSDRLVSGQLTEEYLVPHGTGTFFDVGMLTMCFSCDFDEDGGANIYYGGWVDGSLTGQARVVMNHGGELSGRFELNYLKEGRAKNATASMFGMAYNLFSTVYTGPIVNGFEHGRGGRATDPSKDEVIEGEFRYGFPWNAEHWWTSRDGDRKYCKWIENKCTR